MTIAYKIIEKKLKFDNNSTAKTVYTVRPASFGKLTTEDAAKQIAAESASTPGDVKSVLDRYAYYVKENLSKGYDIELFDFGTLFNRFKTGKAVEDKADADATLVKSLLPGFRPSYSRTRSGARVYDLQNVTVSLVNWDDMNSGKKSTGSGSASSDSGSGSSSGSGSDSGSGSSSGSDSGSGSSSSSDTGSGTFQG